MPKEAKTQQPRFYPADDLPAPKEKAVQNLTKLRESITPGTVLILLAGHFRGKRVVFLKQLSSGLLLISGPFEVNGVPLKRVNQSYVIATRTKVDLPALPIGSIDDDYFAREAEEAQGEEGDRFFSGGAKATSTTSEKRKADQKAVDKLLVDAVGKVEMLEAYLQAKFSLSKGDKPHEMIF
eukprot:CAMPEP_0118973298 /NCGR_PEP_ID=MMETSP1173-20130426/9717_1 /TAXON_ID=1034831 /ORGANISM="Rhizochromulina marina cf, Strain CCMP1243" /LENGTH=180 /DNA_ID=CAMNT_0006922925 /DNA_START=44 /DNA_END=586 /DNA_ORIENTATION=-